MPRTLTSRRGDKSHWFGSPFVPATGGEKTKKLPQMPIRKSSTGTRLEVFLEFTSAGFVTQTHGHDDFPRFELGRVRRLPVVVGGKTGIKVFGNTNVALVGMGNTAEEIDGEHTDALWDTEDVGKADAVGQPSLKLWRAAFAKTRDWPASHSL